MLKLVYVITRRADLSPAQFHDYWLNTHGPLVGAQAGALALRRYVQSHRLDDPAVDAMCRARGLLPPVDGVTEVWWDSLAAMQAAYATEAGAASGRILAADEAKFIDFANSQVFLTREHPVFDRGDGPGPDPVKLIGLHRRRPGQAAAEWQRIWREAHGALATRVAAALDMRRYVQSHTVEDAVNAVNAGFQANGGFAPPLDGASAAWFGSLAAFEQASATLAGQAAMGALAADEHDRVDPAGSRLFLAREHLIFDHTR